MPSVPRGTGSAMAMYVVSWSFWMLVLTLRAAAQASHCWIGVGNVSTCIMAHSYFLGWYRTPAFAMR